MRAARRGRGVAHIPMASRTTRPDMAQQTLQAGGATAAATALKAGRFAIVFLLFTISTDALLSFGWQYADTGGGPLEKLHPATLIALLLFGLAMAQNGNPLSNVLKVAEGHRDLLPYLLGIVFMIVYAVAAIGAPFTIFIETFFGPLILFLLFEHLDATERRRLAWLMHGLLLCNALLGIYEFIYSFHLTPLMINGEVMDDEMRSTALLGHPLANASLVGCYILILALGGGRDLPGIVLLTLFTINAASMVVFGGRAATALLMVGLIVVGFVRLLDVLKGKPIHLSTLRTILACIPVYMLMAVTLAELGYFDPFFNRIENDAGSASTRIAVFSIFEHVPLSELILVPDAQLIGTWVNIHGLNYGIENFVLAFILSFGLLATIVFLPALVLFARAVTRALRPNSGWVFVYFFAVSMTSVGLSAKTPLLSVLIVMMMVLMGRSRRGLALRHGASHEAA